MAPTSPTAASQGVRPLRAPRNSGVGRSEIGSRKSGVGAYRLRFPHTRPPTSYTRGLSAGWQAGQQIAAGVIAAAPIAGPAAPFVALGGELMALFTSFFGGGCGQACQIPARAEQIYERAANDILAVGKDGQLGPNETAAGISAMLNAGIQHLTQLEKQVGQHASDAIANMQNKAIGPEIAVAAALPPASKPLNPQTAPAVFGMAGPGWYSDSAAAGDQLAMAYLASVAGATTVTASGVQVLGVQLSWTEILLGGAVLVGVAWWMS